MKATLNLSNTTHNFNKTNLVTVKGGGDNYACKCGLKGYRPPFQDSILVVGKAKLINEPCPFSEAQPVKELPKKVRITNFGGHSSTFANLTNGSEHDIVECPKEYKNKYANDVWVMGIGEPVRLLGNEYEEI